MLGRKRHNDRDFERGFGRGRGFGGGFGRGRHFDGGYRGGGEGRGFHESFDFFDYEFKHVNNIEELKFIKEQLSQLKSQIKRKIKKVSGRITELEK